VTTLSWHDPAFVAAARAWIAEVAAERGIALAGPVEQPHVRPWSTVFRARADTGVLYLKACAAAQRHEPAIIEVVARESPDLVPDLVARHPSEPWVILRDGGDRLRDRIAGRKRLAVWRALLPRYAELQHRLVGRDEELLAMGLPDRRLDRIPTLLERALSDDRSGAAEPRARVATLLPAIRRACAEVAAAGIGAALDHDDLHDNNVLVRGTRHTIIDWGDASLTHPFLTLAVTLEFAARAAALETGAPEVRALRDAYLEPWTSSAPAAVLRRGAELGAALGTVTGALTWYEIITRIDGALAEQPGEMGAMLERIARAISGLEN
jgi:Phosphotransferase enzyme family